MRPERGDYLSTNSRSSAICTVVDSLCLLILLLQFSLHCEISLPFAFDPLLFHVADHACMHGLESRQLMYHAQFDCTHRFFGCLSPMHESNDTDSTYNGARERDL
jgi:hypothetical protein